MQSKRTVIEEETLSPQEPTRHFLAEKSAKALQKGGLDK